VLAREYNPLSQHDQEPLAKDYSWSFHDREIHRCFSNESYDPVGTEESVPDKFSASNPILSKS